MDVWAALTELKGKHEQLLRDYQQVLKEIQGRDLYSANIELRRMLEDCKNKLVNLETKYRETTQENLMLKSSLREQIIDEKLNIIKISRQKMTLYFGKAAGEFDDKLTKAEKNALFAINSLQKNAQKDLGAECESVQGELVRLTETVRSKLQQQRERYHKGLDHTSRQLNSTLDGLVAEALSEEVIQQRIKHNELEMKIGLNWINKIGIIFIMLGVGAAARYSYVTWFGNHAKGVTFFILAGIMLLAGEFFHRRGKEAFGSGLIGGGISVLYGSTFYSYFLLGILGLNISIVLSVLTTIAAIFLAIRYRSSAICSLGLIGGYLPFFTFIGNYSLDAGGYYVAMGYMLLLNFSVMLISFWQRWNNVKYISMVLHLPSLIYLGFGASNKIVSIIYAVIAFANYAIAVLAYPLRHKATIKTADFVMLVINTIMSCVILFKLFNLAGLYNFRGALALIFCFIYSAITYIVDKRIPHEKSLSQLSYCTALTFAVLVIPLQLKMPWISTGWLIEGTALVIFGLRSGAVKVEKAGWIIYLICIGFFYLLELLARNSGFGFYIKYTAIILSMLIIVYRYLTTVKVDSYRTCLKLNQIHVFKYFTVANVWYFLVFIAGRSVDAANPAGIYNAFFHNILTAVVSIMVAYCLPHIQLIKDSVIDVFGRVFYGFAAFICWYLTAFFPSGSNVLIYQKIGVVATVFIFNIFAYIIFKRELLQMINKYYINYEIYPLLLFVYLVSTFTILLSVQLAVTGKMLYNAVYLAASLGAIYVGFKSGFIYLRRLGLAVTLVTITKFFILDLAYLTALNKIFAYFCYGFILLGISYLYQRLKGDSSEKTGSSDN